MEKKFIVVALMMSVVIGVSFYLIGLRQAESATNFQNIFPFSISGNRVGFFEQNTGRVFVYDNSLKYVVEVFEIEKLGKPLRRLDWRDYLDKDDKKQGY